MPKPKPLTPNQAKHALAHRLGPRVDRLRQLATRFGIRPYRCFLTWVRYAGAERGDGDETVIARVEILPTPRLAELTGVGYRPWSAGTFPEGTIRIDRVSVLFTADNLKGLAIPPALPSIHYSGGAFNGGPDAPKPDPQTDFFWEVTEDGRGDNPSERQRYRLSGRPYRDAGNVHWIVVLESSSDNLDRAGKPQLDQLNVHFDDDTR